MAANNRNRERTFRRVGIITIAAVYILILVGGVVRSTGAGMGCPDWPKCFGNWVPPTEVAQLPDNYQEVYADKRKQKNRHLVSTLEKLGFAQLADKIINDPSIYVEAAFNPVKTWIEYVNRVIGVLIGIFIFLTLIFSLKYFREDWLIPGVSLLAFLLVGFQGWLGSQVVSTNLLPGMITVHMMLAIVIVCLLIYAVARSFRSELLGQAVKQGAVLNSITLLALALSLAQVVLGTQVREEIDVIAGTRGVGRELWIAQLGVEFYIHRSFSIAVLLVNLVLAFQLKKNTEWSGTIRHCTVGMLVVLGISILSGVGMAYFQIPALLQPVHLLLATLLTGIQFLLLLLINQKKVLVNTVSTNPSKHFSYQ